jgi:signal transduction histidine kinase
MVRAAAQVAGRWSWFVTAGALTLFAAVVSAASAGATIRETVSRESIQLLRISRALAESQRLIVAAEARREELAHDARSMIGALRAASTTLDRHAATLDPESAHRLRVAMSVELERLDRLIDGSGFTPIESFAVADVLAPMAAVLREQGLEMVCDVDGLRGLGRADDVAEALRNVLVNAHTHAPGSPVWVSGEATGATLRLFVRDHGPGIPTELAESVFDREFSVGQGSGLGLYVARQLLRAQGGDLQLDTGCTDGACFVVRVPAAPAWDTSRGA